MKVIDLLNKIAKGEENDLITEFVFDSRVWNFYKFNRSEFCLDGWLLNQEIKLTKTLNESRCECIDEEVEKLFEKEIKKIDKWNENIIKDLRKDEEISSWQTRNYLSCLMATQNEIIEILNKSLNKED